MSNYRRYIAIFVAAFLAIAAAQARNAVWEEVARAPKAPATEHIEAEDVTVTTADGYIYITVSRPLTVKVFTILGQIVTQQTLKEGTLRLKLPARGIYILKIGSATRRIAV